MSTVDNKIEQLNAEAERAEAEAARKRQAVEEAHEAVERARDERERQWNQRVVDEYDDEPRRKAELKALADMERAIAEGKPDEPHWIEYRRLRTLRMALNREAAVAAEEAGIAPPQIPPLSSGSEDYSAFKQRIIDRIAKNRAADELDARDEARRDFIAGADAT